MITELWLEFHHVQCEDEHLPPPPISRGLAMYRDARLPLVALEERDMLRREHHGEQKGGEAG